MQLTKELLFPAIKELKECIDVLIHVLPKMEVNTNCAADEKYKYMYSVNKVNELVLSGLSFREAYTVIANKIETDSF